MLAGFRPSKHSSRKGWRAHADDFPRNPFQADPNLRDWTLTDGRQVSLRQIACEVLGVFRASASGGSRARRRTPICARCSKARRARCSTSPNAPPPTTTWAVSIDWGRRRARPLPRSAYERVIQRVIAHTPLRIGRSRYVVERMPGWYEFVFRDVKTGARRTFNLDELARHVTRASRGVRRNLSRDRFGGRRCAQRDSQLLPRRGPRGVRLPATCRLCLAYLHRHREAGPLLAG